MTFGTKGIDLEAGNGQLYPTMMENPQHRWAFIRKVYSILCMQMLLTVAVAVAVVLIKPIPNFIRHTTAGLAVYICVLVLSFIIMWPLHVFQKRYPVNLILLLLFTLLMSFAVGLSCSMRSGKVILEAGILTCVVVIGLTLYTFWAAKRKHHFHFLWPFLFSSFLVLMVFSIIQFFFPLGKLGMMIYGCMGAIIFSGYIIYDTGNLIKRFDKDEFIPAASALYLDIINLFQSLLTAFDASD